MKKLRNMKQTARRFMVVVLVLLASFLYVCEPAFAYNSAVQKARNSVVRVVTVGFTDGDPAFFSIGTGIVVGNSKNQYVLTNRHVVEWEKIRDLLEQYGSSDVMAKIYILSEGNSTVCVPASPEKVRLSQTDDLALIKLDSPLKEREQAVFGDSSDVKVTDKVYAIGFPTKADDVVDKGLSNPDNLEAYLHQNFPSNVEDMTVTDGTVSKTDVSSNGSQYIQHEANTSPGNSGGPLVDDYGHVVGINTEVVTDYQTASRYNYAIELQPIKKFLESNNVSFETGTVVGGVIQKYILFIAVAVVVLLIALLVLKKTLSTVAGSGSSGQSGSGGSSGISPGQAAASAAPPLNSISDVLTRIYSSPGSDKLRVLTNPDYFVEELKRYYRPEFRKDCQILEKTSRGGLGKIIVQYQNQKEIPGDSDKIKIIEQLVSRCGLSESDAARAVSLFFEMVGWNGSVPASGTSSAGGTARTPGSATTASASSSGGYGGFAIGSPSSVPISDTLRKIYQSSDKNRILRDPDYFVEQLAKNYHPDYKNDCKLLEKAARSGLGLIVLQYIQQNASPSDFEADNLSIELCKRCGFSREDAKRAIRLYGDMVGWRL